MSKVLVAVALLGLAGCSAPPDPRRTNFEIRGEEGVAKYDPKTGRLKKIDFDQNKNGRMDGYSYWDATRLIRVEFDRDEDGKIDSWEYYTEKNKIERVGSSSRNDEVQDTWAYPDSTGFLAKVETDADRDGIVEKRELFVPRPGTSNERVSSIVEFGIDKKGQPSLRVHYRPNGEFDHAEKLRPMRPSSSPW